MTPGPGPFGLSPARWDDIPGPNAASLVDGMRPFTRQPSTGGGLFLRDTLLRSRGTARTRAAALVIGLGALSWVILSVVRGASTGRRDAVLHAGTVLICELEHTVSTRTASVGDGVGVRLSEPVAFNGHTIVSPGANHQRT